MKPCSLKQVMVVGLMTVAAICDAQAPKPLLSESFSYYEEEQPVFIEQNQTIVKPLVKTEKQYDSGPRPARQRGRKGVVTLFSRHTREALPVIEGTKIPDAVFDHFFRCRGFGKKTHIDDRLTQIVFEAAKHFGASRVEIISAYRSPKFNDALSKKGRRVARESKHTKGQAVDFRLENVKAEDLGKWLWENFEGGVGTYKNDDFVHVDVGFKRKWSGK